MNTHCFSQSCSGNPIQQYGAHLNTTVIFSSVRKLRISMRISLFQLPLEYRLIIQTTVICFWLLSAALRTSICFVGNYVHLKSSVVLSLPRRWGPAGKKESRPRVLSNALGAQLSKQLLEGD